MCIIQRYFSLVSSLLSRLYELPVFSKLDRAEIYCLGGKQTIIFYYLLKFIFWLQFGGRELMQKDVLYLLVLSLPLPCGFWVPKSVLQACFMNLYLPSHLPATIFYKYKLFSFFKPGSCLIIYSCQYLNESRNLNLLILSFLPSLNE